MSNVKKGTSKSLPRGKRAELSSPQLQMSPRVESSSEATCNSATDSSIQFNADVNKQTRQWGDTNHASSNTFYINFPPSSSGPPPESASASTPRPHPFSASMETERSQTLGDSHYPGRKCLTSGGEISDGFRSLRIKSPMGASGPVSEGNVSNALSETNQNFIDQIRKSVAAISGLYKTLPAKLPRYHRIPGLSSIRKDLEAQNTIFCVAVGEGMGDLIARVVGTLRRAQRHAGGRDAYAPTEPIQDGTVVELIKGRLDSIHGLLTKVDATSDLLAAHQDRLTLPMRPKRDLGRPNNSHTNANTHGRGRAGVTRRRPKSNASRKNSELEPDRIIRGFTSLLNGEIEEFKRLFRSLQPLQAEEPSGSTSVSEDLRLTKTAAILLCKALCQACPNKNHVHRVLFGLSTNDLTSDCEEGDTGIEFSLAFESEFQDEAETWFVVQSTLKGSDKDDMDVDDPQSLISSASHIRSPSLSDLDTGTSPHSNTQPHAQFCLKYHKQGTNDLAVAFKHSEVCDHELFYPDQARLDVIGDIGQAKPLKVLLEDHPLEHPLEMLQKVRLARLLAEAVLKFHDSEWLSCEWDWDSVVVYELEGSLEPHLKFELKDPEGAGKGNEALRESPKSYQVLSQLRKFLGCIVMGPSNRYEAATYEAIQRMSGSTIYADIVQACDEINETGYDLNDEIAQERFYAKVVLRLEELEQLLIEEEW